MEVLRRNPKLVKFLIDIICISCLIGLLFLNLVPGKTGFACNDSSIRKGKKQSSISTNAVFTWGYIIPVILIIANGDSPSRHWPSSVDESVHHQIEH